MYGRLNTAGNINIRVQLNVCQFCKFNALLQLLVKDLQLYEHMQQVGALDYVSALCHGVSSDAYALCNEVNSVAYEEHIRRTGNASWHCANALQGPIRNAFQSGWKLCTFTRPRVCTHIWACAGRRPTWHQCVPIHKLIFQNEGHWHLANANVRSRHCQCPCFVVLLLGSAHGRLQQTTKC